MTVSGGGETSVSPEAHAPNGCDEQGGNCLGAREEDTAAEEERQRPKYRWMKGWRVAHRERDTEIEDTEPCGVLK